MKTQISENAAHASLVALQAASQHLAQAQIGEKDILQRLHSEMQKLLPVGRVHILLFKQDQIELFAWDEDGEALPPSYYQTPVAQSIVGWMRDSRESLLVRDFLNDWDTLPAKPSFEHSNPPRSAIFAPLVVANRALGMISVQSDEPDTFSPDHLWQLRILANQTAATLRAGRLLRTERRRANQLTTLAKVTRSVVSILDLDELLTHVVDLIENAFGYDHVQVFVTEPGTGRARFRASSSLVTNQLWRRVGKSSRIGEGIIGWVLEHGETLVAPDVSIDPLYIPDDPRHLPNIRSEIALPLKLEDQVLGVLDIQSNELNSFDREDLFVLDALSDAVALAVANARLYGRVQEDAWITSALLEVAEATNRLTQLDDVVKTITRITPLLTGVDASAIWLKERDSETFRPVAQWGIHPETIGMFFKHDLVPEDSPALVMIEELERPLVMRPPEMDFLLSPIIGQALLADAIVLLPLFAKGVLIGALSVSIDESDAPLSETRLPLLKGIADQAASAIENAKLIDAQQEEAWISTALLQVAQAMGRARGLPETLDVAARLTAALSGLDRCTILLRQPESGDFRVSISYSLTRELSPIQYDELISPNQIPFLAELDATREPVTLLDAGESDLIPDSVVQSYHLGSLVGLSLVADDQMVGALVVDEIEARRVKNPRLLDMLGGIANQAAVAIERARLQIAEIEQQRVATELGVARNIQIGFLPDHAPQPPGYEIAAIWEPARQIGGDFYDFIPLENGRLGIVVADVADKGIPAALYMALSRTTMRLVSTRNPSPSAALQRVNTAIVDTTYSDLFVTVYYAILDPITHHVTYASGGHGLALKANEDGVAFLRGRGTVLGVFSTISVEEFDTDLAPGDYLVIYTDGVTDAVNTDMQDFGEGRLAALLEQHRGLSAQAMLELIREEVRLWQGEAPSFDDFTLVVVKRKK